MGTLPKAVPLSLLLTVLALTHLAVSLCAADKPGESPPPKAPQLTLVGAAMCESIREYEPYNRSVVFSISRGKVSCFTSFDPVPAKGFIYHNWYFRDVLSTKKRLTLKPPRWATLSSIQLRQADKGPWRVEVTDKRGRVFKVLRFSVID